MKSPIQILIVDDHPFIIEAYKNAINKYSQNGYEFVVTQANNCKTGYENIVNQSRHFDIAFFDISMPEYAEKGIYSGEDLAMLMKTEMPQCKIILLTMHTELLKINNIIKNINPSGLIIKNDLTFDELLFAFDKIINDESYYSQTVIKLVGQAQYNNIELDVFDKQILFHLSKGVKTKDLPTYIPLSLSAIEKRKLNIREILEVAGGTDVDLIREAKNKGVI
ncbi:response regulator transcription factor [Flavobacterium sp. J49]|uniref:response regulator n=1 Tax=Flavobacterium sp. J49 TaxID=2718534 RepID=UPI001594D3F5|nr:response regulator [Flavobacterium sp. J49]MBF6641349.1 response regulator transcription factor [Flavobacterium sp. J49]NIC02596.1 response regulator transcription factor [Flavobacterium sp. J49]